MYNNSLWRRVLLLLTTLGGVAAVVLDVGGAISVGPSGAGPLTFDTQPTGTDFLSAYYAGDGAAFSTTAQSDTSIASLPASALGPTFVLALATTVPPSAYAYAFRWNTNSHYLQSRPTTSNAPSATASAAVVLLATLQNDTGSSQSSVTVSYDMGVTDPLVGELPGHRVYFSMTGAAQSWQVIPEFSGVETNGRLSAVLNLGSWPSGGTMYLLWFDDNANGVTDPGYTIDNLQVALPASIPVALVSSPTNTVADEGQSLALRVGVTGSGLQFQWFHNGAPMANLSYCTNGHDRTITGAAGPNGANLTFKTVEPIDAGQYRCVISNFSGTVFT